MSIASLSRSLEVICEDTLEKISDAIDSHGLDPESDDVLKAVEGWFGFEVREALEDWMS